PVTATASFDPPTAQAGEKLFYRVVINAAQSSIQWPETISAPPELKLNFAARGQIIQFQDDKFRPFTTFLCEARPTATGRFTVPSFTVTVDGKPLQIPAASVDVNNSASTPPRQLELVLSKTNLFLGEPFHASVLLLASPSNTIEALNGIQFNGDGFSVDQESLQQAVKITEFNGRSVPAYVFDATLTPIIAGTLKLSAQGFTAGRQFQGPITITGPVVIPGGEPQYILLVSDPAKIHVRPLPVAGQLPGFTGAIGQFTCDPPQLSTNRISVGQPVQLSVAVHAEGDLNRLVPPTPPMLNDWEIIPDKSGFDFTLIPLTDKVRETPAIPFCYFDPETSEYVDLTIPPVPVTVSDEGLPTELPPAVANAASGPPLNLSELSPVPGEAVSLRPPQLRAWLVAIQLVPLLAILGLWQWDRRRRFLEAHPEIVRRRQARRELRREKRKLQQAIARGDAEGFVRHAANAMQIACAPHYAAHPQALVCAEVLEQTGGAEENETVRKIFAAADSRFAAKPENHEGLLALNFRLKKLLEKMEAQL
ncbi:MAG TPA: hypothetical protein VMB22_08270, partial [Verrucomicrobiae bacterium]|nr:hypothetical protein [Verrucomicrobiae bacterium]